tara:strand:+ start:81 stop:377 length:297 start_codon:yes stop_codon:yes gene_type:complete
MKIEKAIKILTYHQEWRLGKIDEMKFVPKELTTALDIVLDKVKNLALYGVGCSLPTKDKIELRAEQALFGFDKNTRLFDDDYLSGYMDGANWIIENIK